MDDLPILPNFPAIQYAELLCRCITISCMYTITASRNISDWWLAYWISHSHKPHLYTNNNSSNFNFTNFTAYTAAGDNLAFYLGIYGGLAAANSVRRVLG